jgi:hypothetical protein
MKKNKERNEEEIRKRKWEMSLTGVGDVDMEIILQLEDRELSRVCCVNKYLNEICQSDTFWYKRLINRIATARNDNLSKYKQLMLIDINGKRIREMQEYFGLKDLKEVNNFLNELPYKAVYLLYYAFPCFDNHIVKIYEGFDESKLPKYINRKELKYEMRREVAKSHYFLTPDRSLNNYTFRFSIIPAATDLPIESYNAYKTMGL